jgi:ATP-dependent DNA ligase
MTFVGQSTIGKIVPAGADWFHEIKYDGYRVQPSYAQADYYVSTATRLAR